MIEPYYRTIDGRALVYHCTAQELLATLPESSVDLVVTDPPYADKTHRGARTHKRTRKVQRQDQKLIPFKSITEDDLRVILSLVGSVMKRWFVATMDDDHAHAFKTLPPSHMKFVRKGIWVKPNGAPQFTGDRPAQGWEAIVFAHRDGRKMTWTGGGRSSVFVHNVERKARYATQKPLPLVREFIELFSDVGDTVLDPFCGGGTTAVAAYERGRCVITCDPSEDAVKVAAGRLQEVERCGDTLTGTGGEKRSRLVKVTQGSLFDL